MIGPIVIVFILLVAVPVGVLLTGLVLAAGLGWAVNRDRNEAYEGTEYLDLG